MSKDTMTPKETNSSLEENLRTLQKAGTRGDRDELDTIAGEMNAILCQAIEQYPTEVNAVRIPALISIGRKDDRLPHHGTIFSGRAVLNDFLCTVSETEKLSGVVEFEFVKHLPYTFTTGSHGSKERDAMTASCRNIAVETTGRENTLAYFEIAMRDNQALMEECIYLFPDEIQSIKLEQVSDNEFTPCIQKTNSKYELTAPLSSAGHYLYFKGFEGYMISSDHIPNIKRRDDIAKLLKYVILPDRTTGLFRIEERRIQTSYFSGFAADISGNEPVLYEFDSVPIPRGLRNNEIPGRGLMLAANAIIQHRKKPQSNIQTYTGNKIIGKLADLGDKRKF